jgi:hypothetical protein
MSNYTVNVTNNSNNESITISPIDAWGFGCCVPPKGTMNFSFRSENGSESITLAVMQISEGQNKTPSVKSIITDGGISNVKNGNAKPCLLEISNMGDKSITNVTFGQ